MPSLGNIEEFDPATTNTNRYFEYLEQHFIANGVPADTAERFKPRATLISVIGSKVYYVLSDMCSPETPSGKTYDDLATILKGHFAPKKLVITERHRFHNCTFAANLKHFTSTCNFGTHLNEALRDHFICGLRSKEIQKKLLTEEHNFDEALKNALCNSKSQKIHKVEEPEASQIDLPSDPFSLSIYNISTENHGIEVPVKLNGIHLLIELDTASGVPLSPRNLTTGISGRRHSNPSIPACTSTQGTQSKSLVISKSNSSSTVRMLLCHSS